MPPPINAGTPRPLINVDLEKGKLSEFSYELKCAPLLRQINVTLFPEFK